MNYEFSFPTRIAIIIGLIIVVPAVVIAARWLAQGKVTFTSPDPDAFVINMKTEQYYKLPATVVLSAGRHQFSYGAAGRTPRLETVKFPSFRQTRTISFALDKQVYEEEGDHSLDAIPLGRELPYTSLHFKVDFPSEDGVYTITLFPVINDNEDLQTLPQQLNDYGQEAFEWIRSKGVDPANLKIDWVPSKPENVP